MLQPLWTTVWQFFIQLNTHLPYNPAILLLGFQKVIKTYVHISRCSRMLKEAKNWKEPKPSFTNYVLQKINTTLLTKFNRMQVPG